MTGQVAFASTESSGGKKRASGRRVPSPHPTSDPASQRPGNSELREPPCGALPEGTLTSIASARFLSQFPSRAHLLVHPRYTYESAFYVKPCFRHREYNSD